MDNTSNYRSLNPDSARRIFLIGMPAAGKTYWGMKVADAYGLQFTDLDHYIEAVEEMTIAALFAQEGENRFRAKESKYLQQVIKCTTHNTVIACGGGTPCFNNNMALLQAAGTVIYLQATIPSLLQHIQNDDKKRPLLNDKLDVAESLAELQEQRRAMYEQADFILQTKDISLTTFDKIISSCINRH